MLKHWRVVLIICSFILLIGGIVYVGQELDAHQICGEHYVGHMEILETPSYMEYLQGDKVQYRFWQTKEMGCYQPVGE